MSSEPVVRSGTGIWKMPRSRSAQPCGRCPVSRGRVLGQVHGSSQHGLNPPVGNVVLPSVRPTAASDSPGSSCLLGVSLPGSLGSCGRSQAHPCRVSPRTPTLGQACSSLSLFYKLFLISQSRNFCFDFFFIAFIVSFLVQDNECPFYFY